SATKLTAQSIRVDDFVMALSQLTMNLHANAHELENLLLVKQLIHLRRELYESEGRTRITRIATNLRIAWSTVEIWCAFVKFVSRKAKRPGPVRSPAAVNHPALCFRIASSARRTRTCL